MGSMAAVVAMAAPAAFKQPLVLSKSDFTGTAVRQAAGPSSVRPAAPLVVRAIGYDEELRRIARIIASPGRGVFAMDESSVTCGKKLASVGMENTEMNRRAYRQMLVTTPGLGQYISGATLFEETLYQNTIQGKKFVDCLAENGVVPGVKVDRGLVPLPGSNNEYYCQGLDNLHSRSSQFYRAGARFAKWRTVISVPNGPSALAVQRAGIDSALFAAIAQENGLVPIIEAEILLDGDHSIDTTLDVSERVWAEVFYYLAQHRVLLEAIILKPSMITHGAESGRKAPPEQVTDYTLTLLRRVVPNSVPGILFPSGGQSEVEATVNLNALNQRPSQWHLSFSYARALQNTVLRTWKGQTQNVRAAQEALLHRARLNSLAQQGRYPGELETEDSGKPLYEPNYVT